MWHVRSWRRALGRLESAFSCATWRVESGMGPSSWQARRTRREPSHAHHTPQTSRLTSDVVDLARHGDPGARRGVVLGHILPGVHPLLRSPRARVHLLTPLGPLGPAVPKLRCKSTRTTSARLIRPYRLQEPGAKGAGLTRELVLGRHAWKAEGRPEPATLPHLRNIFPSVRAVCWSPQRVMRSVFVEVNLELMSQRLCTPQDKAQAPNSTKCIHLTPPKPLTTWACSLSPSPRPHHAGTRAIHTSPRYGSRVQLP
jgi:hypothetical protein